MKKKVQFVPIMETTRSDRTKNTSEQSWYKALLFLKIFCLCVAGACVFGIALDQVTTRICFEYFSEGVHKIMIEGSWLEQFLRRYPGNCTVWAIAWGIYASWWVGAILGVFLGLASTVGPWPCLSFGRCTVFAVACWLLTSLTVACLGVLNKSYYLDTISKRDVVTICNQFGFRVADSPDKLTEALEQTGRRYLLCGYITNTAYTYGELYGVCLVALAVGWRAYMRYKKQA